LGQPAESLPRPHFIRSRWVMPRQAFASKSLSDKCHARRHGHGL